MKINFDQPVPALTGGERKGPDGKAYLLRDACVTALDSLGQDEMKLDAKEKYRRGDLARRIFGSKEPLNIEAEDVALLKTLTAKIFNSTIIMAEVWDLLDPKGDAPGEKKKPALRIPGTAGSGR